MKRSLKGLCLGAAAAGGLLTAAGVSNAATLVSPVGTWDCIVSGCQGVGLAYLTFTEDYQVKGYELLTTKPTVTPVNPLDPNSRGTSTDYGRSTGDTDRGTATDASRYTSGTSTTTTGTGGSTPVPVTACTNLFGAGEIKGTWTYDLVSGKVVGYLLETPGIYLTPQTNSIPQTNNFGTFSARVVWGRSLSLVSMTGGGKVVYTGLPQAAVLPDISGSWRAYRYQSGLKTADFFELSGTEFPYLFQLKEAAGGPPMSGWCMLSKRKKIAFASDLSVSTSSNAVVRATWGAFYPRTTVAVTKGAERPGARISYVAARYGVAAVQQ